MEDRTLICQECGREFFWSAGEQEFYQEKGLSEPKLCPICRGKKKAREFEAERGGKTRAEGRRFDRGVYGR